MDKRTKLVAAGFFLGKAAKVKASEITRAEGKFMGLTQEEQDTWCLRLGFMALLWLIFGQSQQPSPTAK